MLKCHYGLAFYWESCRYKTEPSQNKARDEETVFLSFSSANSKSEGYIEGTMRNLKQEDFPGRKRLTADVFVNENYERIRRRERNYADRLHVHVLPQMKRKYKKNTKDDESDIFNSSDTSEEKSFHEAEETWRKKDPETPKRNPKLGLYQQSPTIPLSETPDLKKAKNRERSRTNSADRTDTWKKNQCTKRKLCAKSGNPSKQRKSAHPLSAASRKDKDVGTDKKYEDQQQQRRRVNLNKEIVKESHKGNRNCSNIKRIPKRRVTKKERKRRRD